MGVRIKENVTKNFEKIRRGAKKAKERALREFAKQVVATAKQNAPVISGALRDSINFEIMSNGVRIFVGVDYAGFVEFGTTKQGAQPYLLPAIDQHRNLLGKLLKEELNKL